MITILSGPIGGGKTTLLKKAVDLLRARGFAPGGYLCERVMEGGAAAGYDLVDLRGGRRIPFLRRPGSAGEEKVGPYGLRPDGLAAAREIIGRSDPAEPLVVDELGRLEVEGAGVWPAVGPVLADARRTCLVVVREGLLDGFRPHWPAGVGVSVVRLAESRDPGALVDALLKERT